MELIGYGTGAGVLIHGLLGLLIGLGWHLRHFFAVLAVLGAALAVNYLIRRRIWRELAESLNRSMRLALGLWLFLLVLCPALVRVEVRWPATLPDGTYIFKKHGLNVKVQYLTTLPADNYIPYVVTEFFLRRIPFAKVHPLLPLNEVSNRTILMSLVALPFRAVWGWSQPAREQLGTYDYIGGKWHNVEKLNENDSYDQFFIVALFLNSLMLLGLLVLFSNFEVTEGLPAAALLYLTNPYFLSQTIFTWPKAMAAFFVFLCWNSARRQHDPRIVGLCAALAYHSHPASLPIAAGLGLWYLIRAWRDRTGFKPVFQYALVFLVLVLPWFVWTRLILRLPDNMLAQNFFGLGTANTAATPINFIWVRISNLAVAFSPAPLMIYPFNAEEITNYVVRCVPTVVGLFVVVPAFLEFARRWKSERMLLLYGMVIPAAAILLLFSIQFPPVLLGWQPMTGVLLFLGVHRMRRNFSPVTYRVLIALQLICNLAVLGARAYLVGAHLT